VEFTQSAGKKLKRSVLPRKQILLRKKHHKKWHTLKSNDTGSKYLRKSKLKNFKLFTKTK